MKSAQREAARCLACGICSECMSCTFACGRDAIDHDMAPLEEKIEVGALILAPGYQVYHAELSEEYGFGRFPNVITSLQFERMLSASGPTMGHVQRPSDSEPPKRIAFLQCVGSRDQSHDYCSAVCCMYATKEAMMAKEHELRPGHPRFHDGHARLLERLLELFRARPRALRRAVHALPHQRLARRPGHPRADRALPGRGRTAAHDETFDMVVLSVGMEISEPVRDAGPAVGRSSWTSTASAIPCSLTRWKPAVPGFMPSGPFREPKDIPESVIEASGAAAAAAARLGPSRFTLTTTGRSIRPSATSAAKERASACSFATAARTSAAISTCPAWPSTPGSLPSVVHAEVEPVHLLAGQHQAHRRAGPRAQPEPGCGRLLHATDAPAAVPGLHPQRRAEPVPV